jgi:hypothetical protein
LGRTSAEDCALRTEKRARGGWNWELGTGNCTSQKCFDEGGLADAWLTGNEDELPLALPCFFYMLLELRQFGLTTHRD